MITRSTEYSYFLFVFQTNLPRSAHRGPQEGTLADHYLFAT